MKVPQALVRRWMSPIVFGVWMLALIYLLATRRYTAFLRPEFGLLLALAHFVAMGFMIAGMAAETHLPADRSRALRAAILLLPVAYLAFIPSSSLGSRAFQSRFTGPSLAVGADSAGLPPAQGSLSTQRRLWDSESEKTDLQTSGEQTLLELYLDPRRYDGQPVAVTGMLMRDALLEPYFGGRDTAVYRFLITCCAADALPLAIALDPKQVAGLKVDQWIAVAGTFRMIETGSSPVPVIENATVRTIKAPSQPYLF